MNVYKDSVVLAQRRSATYARHVLHHYHMAFSWKYLGCTMSVTFVHCGMHQNPPREMEGGHSDGNVDRFGRIERRIATYHRQ